MERLNRGAAELGLSLTQPQLEQFRLYYQELAAWNQRINLTTIVEYEEVQTKHFLDSLTVSLVIPEAVQAVGRVLDIGSGGGFPGVPLKLVYPGIHLALVESVVKKAAFLDHLIKTLALAEVVVYAERAETLAHTADLRETFDLVISRGVASQSVLNELALPFCRPGGIAVAMKKGDLTDEIEASLKSMEVMGGALEEVRKVDVSGLRDGRALVVVRKVKPTPAQFPRRPGMPAKRPIGTPIRAALKGV